MATDYGCNLTGSANLNPTYQELYGVEGAEYHRRRQMVSEIIERFGNGADRHLNYTNHGIQAYFYGRIDERPEVFREIAIYCENRGYNATINESYSFSGYNRFNCVIITLLNR